MSDIIYDTVSASCNSRFGRYHTFRTDPDDPEKYGLMFGVTPLVHGAKYRAYMFLILNFPPDSIRNYTPDNCPRLELSIGTYYEKWATWTQSSQDAYRYWGCTQRLQFDFTVPSSYDNDKLPELYMSMIMKLNGVPLADELYYTVTSVFVTDMSGNVVRRYPYNYAPKPINIDFIKNGRVQRARVISDGEVQWCYHYLHMRKGNAVRHLPLCTYNNTKQTWITTYPSNGGSGRYLYYTNNKDCLPVIGIKGSRYGDQYYLPSYINYWNAGNGSFQANSVNFNRYDEIAV